MKDPSTGKVRVLSLGNGEASAAVFGRCGMGHLGSVSPARTVAISLENLRNAGVGASVTCAAGLEASS